jgi:hypothetical protein
VISILKAGKECSPLLAVAQKVSPAMTVNSSKNLLQASLYTNKLGLAVELQMQLPVKSLHDGLSSIPVVDQEGIVTKEL